MTKKSKTLLFFGNERILSGVDFDRSPVLEQLIKDGFSVAGVVLNKHETKTRKPMNEATASLAKAHNIPVFYPSSSSEIESIVDNTNAFGAVLIAFGMIIPSVVLSKLEGGIINVHPSLLPKYRGSSPIETAILNGDTEIGVSLMRIEEKMDAGPIYIQQSIKVVNDDKLFIANQLLSVAQQLIHDNLSKILDGELQPSAQDEDKATYTAKLTKQQAVLDTDKMSAREALNVIRAYKYYPKAKLSIGSHTVFPLKAHSSIKPEGLSVVCADQKYLVIDELMAPNGKTMSGEQFAIGYLST